MAGLIIFVALVLVVVVVGSPLRDRGKHAQTEAEAQVAELEARKEAKYREIRDAELDFRTGKLSDEDYRSQDRALRAEAMEILRELDEAQAGVATEGDAT